MGNDYSPIVECMYFQDARNAEIAPIHEKIGISHQAYETNNDEKSDKKGRKSENNA